MTAEKPQIGIAGAPERFEDPNVSLALRGVNHLIYARPQSKGMGIDTSNDELNYFLCDLEERDDETVMINTIPNIVSSLRGGNKGEIIVHQNNNVHSYMTGFIIAKKINHGENLEAREREGEIELVEAKGGRREREEVIEFCKKNSNQTLEEQLREIRRQYVSQRNIPFLSKGEISDITSLLENNTSIGAIKKEIMAALDEGILISIWREEGNMPFRLTPNKFPTNHNLQFLEISPKDLLTKIDNGGLWK